MALYVSGWIASVAACVRFFLPVRASTPGVALEDIVEGVTRRVSLWLVFSWALRKAQQKRRRENNFVETQSTVRQSAHLHAPCLKRNNDSATTNRNRSERNR